MTSEFSIPEWLFGRWMRLWRGVAVFACARLNTRLDGDQCTYVVTMTGEPRGR